MPDSSGARRSGPFADLVVVDFTHALSGPFCTMLLADLGARVIKIERPPIGDTARLFPPLVDGQSVFFGMVNRGKQSIALDIEVAADREVLHQILRRTDVVVENFRPGTLDRHGLGYETLRELNPRIIFASVSGFGETGPDSWEGAYDSVIQAMSGFASVNGMPDGPPMLSGEPIADCLTGIYTFGAIATALYARETSGAGAHIDIAMFDCLFSVLANGLATYLGTGQIPQRIGNRCALAAPFGLFKTGSGELAICAADDQGFAKLCAAIERPDLLRDPRFGDNVSRLANVGALTATIEQSLQTHSALDWVEPLQKAGVACGVVNTIDQAANDPQTAARNMIVRAGNLRVGGTPIKFRGADDTGERRPAPTVDADGHAIRREFAPRTG